MSDDTAERWAMPPALNKDDQARHDRATLAFQERELRRNQWGGRLLWGYAAGMTAVVGLLSVALAGAVPNIRLQPVFLFNQPDGTVDAVSNASSLPATITEAQERAWLWQYVRLRESYVYPDAHDNYDIVSAMSAPDVRDRFQAWYNDKMPGALGPTKTMGKNGVIRAVFRDSEVNGDAFTVRFCRYTSLEGQPPMAQSMIARLRFQRTNTITLLDRVQYNPNALIVTSYPGAIEQGASAAECPTMRAF